MTSGPVTREAVLGALHDVIDPEIGINIVDLGLVYEVRVRDSEVRLRMAMTSPVCPLGGLLAGEAEAAVRRHLPSVASVGVEIVTEPPWHPGLMSEAARRQLG